MARASTVGSGYPLPTMVKCKCGKKLRARPEFVGSEIVCWNCHASVPVPIHVAPGSWVACLLRMGARQLLEARTISLLAIGAITVTFSLRIPQYGVWGAAVALALVMVGYGELLRRGSQGDWTSPPRVSVLMRLWRALLCLGAASALAFPLILAWIRQTAPRLSIVGVGIAAIGCMILPLVMLGTYAPQGSIRERIRMIGTMIGRHPLATLCTLLLLPTTLLAVEVWLYEAIRWQDLFRYFVFELFPLPADTKYFMSRIYVKDIDFLVVPMPLFDASYASALRQGYTFTGSIAASLALPISNGIDPTVLYIRGESYLYWRLGFTVFTVMCMLAALAVQARWLGLLLTLDSRRNEAEVAVSASTSATIEQLVLPSDQKQLA